jgi:hypothetical protein
MAERRDADVLEIVICQPAEQLAVDVVGAENLSPHLGSCQRQFSKKVESLAPTVIPRGFLNQLGFAMWTPPLDRSIAAPSSDTRPI